MPSIYINLDNLAPRVGPPELSTPLAERRTSDASLPEPTSAVSSLANSPRALTPEATFLVDRPASHTAIGSRAALRYKFGAESHNFEPDENEAWRVHEAKRRAGELFGAHTGRQRALARWMFTAIVAVLTELICVFIIACTAKLCDLKFNSVLALVEIGTWYATTAAFVVFLSFCCVFALAATLMAYIEPACAGSGIPEIKSYLNGIDLPDILRGRTLVTKVVGIIFAQASGLPLGKEGPMIHIGAIVGSVFSQGRSRIFGMNTSWLKFEDFRNHREKRDFVTCGTAAGVAAAFGAPIGGVLFAMEEGASYWSLKLSWRTFYCAVLTSLLGLILVQHLPATYVAQFYYCDPFPAGAPLYGLQDLLVFTVMGAGGGLIGAVFNSLNWRVAEWRHRHAKNHKRRTMEVLVVTSIMAVLSFTIPFAVSDNCKPLPSQTGRVEVFTYNSTLRRFTCGDPEDYNELASLYLNSFDDALRLLFHLPMYTGDGELVFSYRCLWGFFFPYFIMAFVTFGTAVPAGLFIPSLVSGAALGRVVGQAIYTRSGTFAAPGVYALIGASAVLGGMTRMTISLSLILLEATGNLYFLIPFMATLLSARWIGNMFSDGIYDMHIRRKRIPFLEPQCPKEGRVTDLRAFEIMAVDLKTLPPVAKVETIYNLLYTTGHNCFPLIDKADDDAIFGTVLRDTLCALLALRAFSRSTEVDPHSPLPQSPVVPWRDIEGFFPHYPDIGSIWLTFEEKRRYIDLRPYCNTAPYVLSQSASALRTYRLFRTQGMRHLLIIDRRGKLVGMITRHDLEEDHMDQAKVQQLHRSRDGAFWTLPPDGGYEMTAPRPPGAPLPRAGTGLILASPRAFMGAAPAGH